MSSARHMYKNITCRALESRHIQWTIPHAFIWTLRTTQGESFNKYVFFLSQIQSQKCKLKGQVSIRYSIERWYLKVKVSSI